MKLGVCYYPEHWPEANWARDGARMYTLGLRWVRIGEFAWAQIEPEPGTYNWEWLDRAVDTLAGAGLHIIMGTPTATPPKWLVDKHPDILPHDEQGQPRRFGSRRHYCFSSQTYARETARITTAMVERYGHHPAIAMWQTDNEYGCHDTVESFSPDAQAAFRKWLEAKYASIDVLNATWGTAFWSQLYRSFDEVDPPMATVTEAHPAHRHDWRTFSSDQVIAYNRMQVEIIRAHTSGRLVTHNFMGHFTAFDHYDMGPDLDIAAWDSYPLGFLEEAWWADDVKAAYEQTGHPDFAAFHHDLYRGLCGGRFAVMEQQPGPVNWARHNPAPKPGMVTLWTLEAAAHGAEFVSYFRWRQAPFAQEQMHAGLNRPDGSADTASSEAAVALSALDVLGDLPETGRADVALIFDYRAQWLFEIQPQGQNFRHDELAFAFYSALRRAGLSIDIVSPDAALDGYKLIVAPSLPWIGTARAAALKASDAHILLGPRSGSKGAHVNLPTEDSEGLFPFLGASIVRAESLRPGRRRTGLTRHGVGFASERWLDHIQGDALETVEELDDGTGVLFRNGRVHFLATWPDAPLVDAVIADLATEAGLSVCGPLPGGLRLRQRGPLMFAINYGLPCDLLALGLIDRPADLIWGTAHLETAGVAVWQMSDEV